MVEQYRVSYFTGGLNFLAVILWDAFHLGIFAWLAARLRPRGRGMVLLHPAVWVAVEFLWPHLYPWRLGQSQIRWTTLIQFGEITGAYGVSFLIVSMATVAALALKAWLGQRRQPSILGPSMALPAAACLVVFALALGFGAWRVSQIEASLTSRPSLTVALVQPDQAGRQWCRAQTRKLQGTADVVCWSASSVGTYSQALQHFRSGQEVQAKSREPRRGLQPLPVAVLRANIARRHPADHREGIHCPDNSGTRSRRG